MFSPREGEVLELIAQGRTNREIAAELDVTVRTVKTHVEHLFRKRSVSHRTQAVLWAADPSRWPRKGKQWAARQFCWSEEGCATSGSLSTFLDSSSYRVTCAGTGAEARSILITARILEVR